jgi:hypothetical protein
MFIDLPDSCCYGDRNMWNTFPVSGHKITLVIELQIIK